MKNTILTLALIHFIFILTAQTPLPILHQNDVYNYAEGDTFHYLLSRNHYLFQEFQATNIQKAILSKKSVTAGNNKIFSYIVKQEGFEPPFSKDTIIVPSYFVTNISIQNFVDDPNKVLYHACPITGIQTLNQYCSDSTVLEYRNRRTYKHEYKNTENTFQKLIYAEGLGQVLDSSYTNGKQNLTTLKLVYFNKNGEKWGNMLSEIENNKQKYRPLKIREIYNFNIGDTFHYKSMLDILNPQNFDCKTLENFTQTVVLNKKYSQNNDTIIYTFKDGFNAPYRVYDLKLANLDFIVTNDERNTAYSAEFWSFLYFSEKIEFIDNRKKTSIIFNYNLPSGYTYEYMDGLGIVREYRGSDTPCGVYEKKLIYYKSGNTVWGKPHIISTINTPSVSQAKMTVSPNPATDILNIETDISFDKIKITNLNGQMVLSENNKRQVNVNHLPNGIYFLQIFENEILRGVKKIVIQH